MKLYNVPRNTLVRVLPQPVEETTVPEEAGQLEMIFNEPADPALIKVPVAAPEIQVDEYIHFGHIDGMYSFCRNMDQEIVHMAAWTEVEVVDWTYENMELLRTIIKRGGRGKDGTEELKWVRTDEMNDAWVAACITYEQEHRPTNGMIEFYNWELKYRKENGITIAE